MSLRNFNSRDDHNGIEIIQTKIDAFNLNLNINTAARRLKMENVYLGIFNDLEIYIGKEAHDCETVSVFELEDWACKNIVVRSTIIKVKKPVF